MMDATRWRTSCKNTQRILLRIHSHTYTPNECQGTIISNAPHQLCRSARPPHGRVEHDRERIITASNPARHTNRQEYARERERKRERERSSTRLDGKSASPIQTAQAVHAAIRRLTYTLRLLLRLVAITSAMLSNCNC